VFITTLQATNEVEGNYFGMDAKRRILIVSFLNYIQEKNVGRPRNQKQLRLQNFYRVRLVAWKRRPGSGGLEAAAWRHEMHTENLPAFRLCEPHQKIATAAPFLCLPTFFS
jgi:hypothetical protein